MFVCRHKITGRLLQAHSETSKARDILFKNQSQYYPLEELEVVIMSDAEYAIAIAQQNFDCLTYAQKRAREYPDFREYLDGIVKGDKAQVQKYINDCLAVKAKYPKQ